jgi:sec-independent protein translocase protein TatA
MGFWELLLVLILVLLFFGASRLPAIGQGLGKALRNVKGAAGTGGRGAPRDAAPRELPPGGKDPGA